MRKKILIMDDESSLKKSIPLELNRKEVDTDSDLENHSLIAPDIVNSKETEKNALAYVLLKVHPNEDFFEVYKKLYFMKNILYCDATRGDVDIFLLIYAESIEKCREFFENEIKSIAGITYAEFLPVDKPALNPGAGETNEITVTPQLNVNQNLDKIRDSKDYVCTYVLAEIKKEKFDGIYRAIKLIDNVVGCHFINTTNNLIIMMSGNNFTQIDKLIEGRLININGIIKVKKYPIINIYEL